MTQNESNFQTSAKVFTSIKTGPEKQHLHRPSLNGYKREFSMPNHFHIEVPTRTSKHNRVKTMDSNGEKSADLAKVRLESPAAEVADSLLIKHHGWITIDGENMNRK